MTDRDEDREDRRRLARWVFASLDDVPVVAVEILATALRLAGGTAGAFAPACSYFADVRRYGGRDDLAALAMDVALRRTAMFAPDCDELIEHLEGVEVPPWPRLAAALGAVRRGATAELVAMIDRDPRALPGEGLSAETPTKEK